MGTSKKIEFNDTPATKQFESTQPVNVDSRKVKNFIEQNKKKIRSRSKTTGTESSNRPLGAKNKSILKTNFNSMLTDDKNQFYEAEDQGIQTSFILQETEPRSTEVCSCKLLSPQAKPLYSSNQWNT
jgi:hypothetical protein